MSTFLGFAHSPDGWIDVSHGEVRLFRYHYRPTTPLDESRKPYVHPLATLAGNVVTAFRPHDHLWHHGLSMVFAELSGQNFWGGATYVHGRGYQPIGNHGTQTHDAWDVIDCDGAAGTFAAQQRLTWRDQHGEAWLREERSIRVGDVLPDEGRYTLRTSFRLTNIAGRTLSFGSPTTLGRPAAGYGSLFWRGPRDFRDGKAFTSTGLEGGAAIMGQPAAWLAYVGRHDESGAASTLVFVDQPGNPRYPNKWFVRTDPFAVVSCSFMFDEEYPLPAGQTLALDYAIVIADGALSAEEVDAVAKTA